MAGADGLCELVAADGGPWRAILTDSAATASERIEVSGPVINMLGEVVAHDADELWSNAAFAPVGYSDHAEPIPVNDLAWTGTAVDNCTDWTSSELDVSAGFGVPTENELWLDSGLTIACTAVLHLYCISQ